MNQLNIVHCTYYHASNGGFKTTCKVQRSSMICKWTTWAWIVCSKKRSSEYFSNCYNCNDEHKCTKVCQKLRSRDTVSWKIRFLRLTFARCSRPLDDRVVSSMWLVNRKTCRTVSFRLSLKDELNDPRRPRPLRPLSNVTCSRVPMHWRCRCHKLHSTYLLRTFWRSCSGIRLIAKCIPHLW